MNFFFPGRHLLACSAINNVYFLGTQTQGTAGDVNGHIAAADNRYLIAGVGLARQVHFSQIIDALADAIGIFSRDTQFDPFVSTKGQIDCLISVA